MSNEQDFTLLISKQLNQVKQLEQILLQEKDVLQQQDLNSLVKLTNEKNDLLILIEATDQNTKTYPNSKSLLQQSACKELISEIENILAVCRKQNDINGLIIQQSALAIERMKSALLENRSKSSMTYDNKGKKSGGLISKGIKA